MELAGAGAIVTGGGSGLGEASARALAARGAKVCVLDLARSKGAEVAASLGGDAFFADADVSSEASVQAAVRQAVEHFGALRILLNCAGVAVGLRTVGKDGPHPLAAFERVVRVNLIGSFNAIRLAAAAMTTNPPDPNGERGVIVNTASAAAFEGQIGQAAYSASKGGVVGMTLPIARDLASAGIRVCTIAPGLFDTPMLAGLPEPVRASLGASIPFPPRLGRPSEYAALACAIIENPMLNGETIRLDGALRMAPR
ncbi:MAG: 3-hydroxyacyl-CoA dehydrogenase [Deltaproteobacteria bacterium]|nr:MAG: 3-hydroxyacyl-CoA dehydrogenase [Deltaproteobacteria bacterium]